MRSQLAMALAALIAAISYEFPRLSSAQDRLPARPVQIEPVPGAVPEAPGLVPPTQSAPRDVTDPTRRHWVVLDDGAIRGQVTVQDVRGRSRPAADMYLKLLRYGVTVATAMSDAQGSFEFRGLGPGVYGMYGIGPRGMMAFSVRLVDERDPRLQVDPRLRRHMPARGTYMQVRAVPPPLEPIAGILRNAALRAGATPLSDAERRLSTALVSRSAVEPLRLIPLGRQQPSGPPIPATSIRHHVIDLTPEGSMRGAVRLLELSPAELARVDHSGLTVYLIRSDQRVQQAAVFEDGSFEVKSLRPGVYGFVVAGSWRYKTANLEDPVPESELYGPPRFGFAAIQIRTRQATEAPPSPNDKGTQDRSEAGAQLVSRSAVNLAEDGFPFEIALLQQMTIEELREFWASLTPEQRVQLLAGFRGGPGGGGGGGGTGGFGQLLGFLGVAGLAGGGGGGFGPAGSPAE